MAIIPYYYKIENGAYKDAAFTTSSSCTRLSDAITLTRKMGGVLQSAREATAFCIEANGADNANLAQATRTVVAYVQVGDKWYAAVDDIADPEQNIVLAMHKQIDEKDTISLTETDPHVRGILERAKRDSRMFLISKQSDLELATQPEEGISPFGLCAGIRAILGNDSQPEAYAAFLYSSGKKTGQFHVMPFPEPNFHARGSVPIGFVTLNYQTGCDIQSFNGISVGNVPKGPLHARGVVYTSYE